MQLWHLAAGCCCCSSVASAAHLVNPTGQHCAGDAPCCKDVVAPHQHAEHKGGHEPLGLQGAGADLWTEEGNEEGPGQGRHQHPADAGGMMHDVQALPSMAWLFLQRPASSISIALSISIAHRFIDSVKDAVVARHACVCCLLLKRFRGQALCYRRSSVCISRPKIATRQQRLGLLSSVDDLHRPCLSRRHNDG